MRIHGLVKKVFSRPSLSIGLVIALLSVAFWVIKRHELAPGKIRSPCTSDSCQSNKSREPDYRYIGTLKDTCIGYKAERGGISFSCHGETGYSSGWMPEFEQPDTTEIIGRDAESSECSRIAMYLTGRIKRLYPVAGDSAYVVFVTDPELGEKLIRFRLGDSLGVIETSERSDNWKSDRHAAEQPSNTEQAMSRRIVRRSIDVSTLDRILVSKEIDIRGPIKKNVKIFSEGNLLSIRTIRAGERYCAEINLIPWFNPDYEAFVKEMRKIIIMDLRLLKEVP